MKVAVVGCGAFGLGAAIELRARGHAVTAFEQGPVPNPKASSHDTSKTIRRVYGAQAHYVELVERAAVKWRAWQARLGARSGLFFNEIGYIYVVRDFVPGDRVHDAWRLLEDRPEVSIVPLAEARARFPHFALRAGDTVLHDRWGGYLASARAVAAMAEIARADGVDVREHSRVESVEELADRFDRVIVAAGTWIPRLVPSIPVHVTRQCMAFFRYPPGSMPVFSLRSDAPGYWYGHPLADEGLVKVADDERDWASAVTPEKVVDPDSHREAPPEFVPRVRAFVAERMPALADAEIVGTRSCLYENTPDHDFVIDWAPGSASVLVAGGGSGHGFKFGGSIGEVIADALERKANPLLPHFRLARLVERPTSQ
jgi:glycine/D-amino acid oxidase-like deaminating enzyme